MQLKTALAGAVLASGMLGVAQAGEPRRVANTSEHRSVEGGDAVQSQAGQVEDYDRLTPEERRALREETKNRQHARFFGKRGLRQAYAEEYKHRSRV